MAEPAPGHSPVDGALEFLDRLARLIVVVAISGMVAIVASQVFARYVLNNSISWADEVSRLLFVWSIFMAIPLGIRRQSHIGVTLVTDRLPLAARHLLAKPVMATAAALMLLVAWQAFNIARAQWDELMVSIDLSAGYFLLAVGTGCLLSALQLMRIAVYGQYPMALETPSDGAAAS